MPDFCELPLSTATPAEIRDLLRSGHTVAVAGLSEKPDRDSYRVAAYLQQAGYRIIPVNPVVKEVLGEKSYAALGDIPEKIDLVNIFRKPDAVPGIVDAAIDVGAKAVWLQEGVVHNAAAGQARAAGLEAGLGQLSLAGRA